MNKIQDYINKRIQQVKGMKIAGTTDLFLGYRPSEVLHFVTWKELIEKPVVQIKRINSFLKDKNVKLIINGNLSDKMIQTFLKMAVKLNTIFSIVVIDGYKEMKMNMTDSINIAILITKNRENSESG